MPDPLAIYKEALKDLCGRASFVLPYPYKRGHFRTQLVEFAKMPKGLNVKKEGNCLYWTLTDDALLLAVSSLAVDGVKVEPSLGPQHTLLLQIERAQGAAQTEEPISDNQRFLLRAALDLPRQKAANGAAKSFMRQCLYLLDREFALSLSNGKVPPALKTCAAAFAAYLFLLDES